MSHIRFNHVFFVLMLLAVVLAFFSPRVSERAQAQLQTLFVPIARPIHSMAGWSHDKVAPTTIRDDASPHQPRDLGEVLRENSDLRMQILTLNGELEKLKELNADRSKLGDLRSRCTPVEVVAGDSGARESLLLSGGSTAGLRDGMPVLCPDGVVGRLTRTGLTSARVKLITDKGTKVQVALARFEKDTGGVTKMSTVTYPDCIAIGQGQGQMVVMHQPWQELSATVKPNDWAVLNDPDWSRLSYRVGRVSSIDPQPGAPGFGQIHIESVVELSMLREVMVLTK
jgi:hypothetical protein